MIAHVAEAHEDRGRVIVQLGAFTLSSAAAIAAAVHVALAFRSQLEGLFVETIDIETVGTLDGVRELAFHGCKSEPLSNARLLQDTTHFAVAAQRELANAAAKATVAFTAKVSRDTPIGALQTACSHSGPWNIVVCAEPVSTASQSAALSAIMAEVFGTTGTIAASRTAQWRKGPIIAAVEDIDRFNGMLRAAQRLAAVDGDTVYILPIGVDEIALDWLESEIRLTLGDIASIVVLPRPLHVHAPGVQNAAIAHYNPRLVIARHGGHLFPYEAASTPLTELGCPVFLIH